MKSAIGILSISFLLCLGCNSNQNTGDHESRHDSSPPGSISIPDSASDTSKFKTEVLDTNSKFRDTSQSAKPSR